MITVVCGCGQERGLSPALAGLTVVCKQCGAPVRVPRAEGAAPATLPPPPPRVKLSPPPPAKLPLPPLPPPPLAEAIPVEPPQPVVEWATRGQRLLARIIDTVILLAVVFGTRYLIVPLVPESGFFVLFGGLFLVVMIQVAMLTTRGQHVGKWVLGLVIVRADGSQAGFVHGFLLRDGVTMLIGLIPLVGGPYKLANDLFIFSADQRCLHDRIAGTRVIKLPY